MAGEELQVVRLRDDFYRDGFYKVIIALAAIVAAIVFLLTISIYLYVTKPPPVSFTTDNEWRVLQPVPLDQVYLSTPDLIQWVSEALPGVFTYDFIHYTERLKDAGQYFTANGWKKFIDQVNVYANYKKVLDSKLFINAVPGGAPFIVNQGVLDGRYAWWVQMPININYVTLGAKSSQAITIQVLVVRVPTLNNLYGVGIENFIVSK